MRAVSRNELCEEAAYGLCPSPILLRCHLNCNEKQTLDFRFQPTVTAVYSQTAGWECEQNNNGVI